MYGTVRRSGFYQRCGSALVCGSGTDPDPGSQTNADQGPGQTFESQNVEFLHKKFTISR
jgi:hypothetical protein